jgi:threonyl-tRNA synthetase
MPSVTLPDNSIRSFDSPVTVEELAADIGSGLAKATVAGRIDGKLVDASELIVDDARVEILTVNDPEGLEVVRHSCAHLLAHALKQLYPEIKLAIGPVIEHGFYYDVLLEDSLGEDDLFKVEKRMTELAQRNYTVKRRVVERAEAAAVFKDRQEPYKQMLVNGIPDGEVIALYEHEEYIDMCRGPHVTNTRHLNAFKLTKVAGAYWRGDSANEMLQRIYGTAWGSKKDLKLHLHQLEEAEKRNHRKIGPQLDLFHFQEEAPGMVFWHDKGWRLFRTVKDHVREACFAGYDEVDTPQVLDKTLWERSGHWDKFGDMIFATQSDRREYAIKPMNCPGHVQIFNNKLRSYRDLPYRVAEFGVVHRNEPSGTLHGLLRARRFTQDDAHIFCDEEDLQREVGVLIDLTFKVYEDFGFDDIAVALSLRPEKRVGSDALWDKSENALVTALKRKGLDFAVQPGEGAFYGPKIEFSLKDSIGRVWQCGTIQVDFSMPDRLGATFVAEDGRRRVPVMIHRAILGSLERFIGVLIEEHAGKLPPWLSPVQAVVMNITDKYADYALEVSESLKKHGFRIDLDLRNEKIGLKIREHTLQKVPFLLVVGQRELETSTISVRALDGDDLGSMSIEKFENRLNQAIGLRCRKQREG